jgi:hypothetical protein
VLYFRQLPLTNAKEPREFLLKHRASKLTDTRPNCPEVRSFLHLPEYPLLIRQHQLDANLVKAYAADSCGTPNLRDATREKIETFIGNLADWATKDRPALLCKLNSYAAPHEVSS